MRSKKHLKIIAMAFSFLFISEYASAAFVLNGTRYVFPGDKKNISFEINNNADSAFGGQVWIDNLSESKKDIYLVPSPPVFKVDAGKKQIVRILKVSENLPLDRESLFLINAQELPPKSEQSDGSVLAIAMNTQVKLFYRPSTIIDGRDNAESKLTVVRKGNEIWLKNPTPYYFAITGIKVNGSEVKIPKDKVADLVTFRPLTEVNTGVSSGPGKVSVKAINDWGGVQEYEVL